MKLKLAQRCLKGEPEQKVKMQEVLEFRDVELSFKDYGQKNLTISKISS